MKVHLLFRNFSNHKIDYPKHKLLGWMHGKCGNMFVRSCGSLLASTTSRKHSIEIEMSGGKKRPRGKQKTLTLDARAWNGLGWAGLTDDAARRATILRALLSRSRFPADPCYAMRSPHSQLWKLIAAAARCNGFQFSNNRNKSCIHIWNYNHLTFRSIRYRRSKCRGQAKLQRTDGPYNEQNNNRND